MRTPIVTIIAVIVVGCSLAPHRSDAAPKSNATSSAAKIAETNGIPASQAGGLSAKLRGIFQSSRAADARIAEVVKLCEAEPSHAAAIAAAATAFVPEQGFAPDMAEAAAKAVRSQAAAIAGAVAAANPGEATRIAARVAKAAPMAATRITRTVAYAVPGCIEGIDLKTRRSRGLESAIIMAVPSANPPSIMNAAHSGAKQAEREGRAIPRS